MTEQTTPPEDFHDNEVAQAAAAAQAEIGVEPDEAPEPEGAHPDTSQLDPHDAVESVDSPPAAAPTEVPE